MLQKDSSPECLVWSRWGRVGAKTKKKGQTLRLPGTKYNEKTGSGGFDGCVPAAVACDEFAKKFKAKTKNNWAGILKGSAFVFHSDKYDLIDVDYGATEEEIERHERAVADAQKAIAESKASASTETKLNARVFELMRLIFDRSAFEKIVTQQEYDSKCTRV